jgi:hypothetical protein
MIRWETEEKIRDAVEAAWRQHRQRDGESPWRPRLSPPLPSAWPPDGQRRLLTYAYAFRLKPSIGQGEEIASPWARVITGDGIVELEELGHPRPLGLQGVRPLSAEELEIARTAPAAAAELDRLVQGVDLPEAPPVLRYYCFWRQVNGVLAAELEQRHPEFFRWLACPGSIHSSPGE